MRKTLLKIGVGIAGVFILVGVTFAIIRPDYVQEAVGILLDNELEFDENNDSSEMGE